jgi:hypothetical protein
MDHAGIPSGDVLTFIEWAGITLVILVAVMLVDGLIHYLRRRRQ